MTQEERQEIIKAMGIDERRQKVEPKKEWLQRFGTWMMFLIGTVLMASGFSVLILMYFLAR